MSHWRFRGKQGNFTLSPTGPIVVANFPLMPPTPMLQPSFQPVGGPQLPPPVILDSKEQKDPDIFVSRPVAARFSFAFDPKTPTASLLPTPPKSSVKVRPLLNDDLVNVPELTFGEPIAKTLTKLNAIKETAHTIAKINHLNQAKTDGFMEAMIAQRTDFQGMPFLMGKECRTGEGQANAFNRIANQLNQIMNQARTQQAGDLAFADLLDHHMKPLKQMVTNPTELEGFHRATVAATMQILMPESERLRVRSGEVPQHSSSRDATRALAKLAIFSPEKVFARRPSKA